MTEKLESASFYADLFESRREILERPHAFSVHIEASPRHCTFILMSEIVGGVIERVTFFKPEVSG